MHLIKRYSNRKLYDTQTRTYITLEGVTALVVAGAEIKVVDNDTDEDLTTVVLSQLLLERERAGRSLSSTLLSGLIRSGETLGRSLSSLARPLNRVTLLGALEHEVERSLKFWLEVGQGSEEEVLKLIENLIERRRRVRTSNGEGTRPGSGPGLLRRRGLDDFETWDEPVPPGRPDPPGVDDAEARKLISRAAQLALWLAQEGEGENRAGLWRSELAEISRRLVELAAEHRPD